MIGTHKKNWPLSFHQKTLISLRPNKIKNPKLIPGEWKKTYYKAYARFPAIKLPLPAQITVPLTKTLTSRISLQSLAFILRYSAGEIKKPVTHRPYPSAGARYPLEAYIIALNIQEVPQGIYHYYVKEHLLEQLSEISIQKIPKDASALIVVTGVMKRTTAKYGDRGYRYALTEAGHLGQNIYLTSTAQKLGCCAIGGFMDEELAHIMRLDPTEEPILYVYAVGKTKK